jgi:hypothetical protein
VYSSTVLLEVSVRSFDRIYLSNEGVNHFTVTFGADGVIEVYAAIIGFRDMAQYTTNL